MELALTDEEVCCREVGCEEKLPRYAMPVSGLCPRHEEERVARIAVPWWRDEEVTDRDNILRLLFGADVSF